MIVSWALAIALGSGLFAISYSKKSVNGKLLLNLVLVGFGGVVYALVLSSAAGYSIVGVLLLDDYPQSGRFVVIAYGLLLFAAARFLLQVFRGTAKVDKP